MKPNQHTGMLSLFRPPLVYELTGRQFTLVFDDGYDRTLVFRDRKTLSFGKEGEEKDYAYECLKIADRCYFVNFEDPALRPRLGITLVLDLVQDLVTMALARMYTNPKVPGIPSDEYIFGAILRADGTVPDVRHGYTSDLVGISVSWNYGYFDIAHVYATEHYYRVSFSPRGLARAYQGRPELRRGGMGGRTPSSRDIYEDYLTPIKIRDRIYLVGLLETVKARSQGHGNSILVLMDLDEMHDVGRSFGSNNEGGNGNNTLGAFGVFHDASSVLAKESTLYIR
ncbi:MAG: MoaF N-terminal domain-containing protein [Oscillospiraceae bacterium]|nr:MoaF N-terminal domain-containing protein [Oscillospiraceae bacterium]